MPATVTLRLKSATICRSIQKWVRENFEYATSLKEYALETAVEQSVLVEHLAYFAERGGPRPPITYTPKLAILVSAYMEDEAHVDTTKVTFQFDDKNEAMLFKLRFSGQ